MAEHVFQLLLLFCAGEEAVAPAAQQRLLKVCRQVITQAAEDTWQQMSQQTGMHQQGTDGSSWEQVTFNSLSFDRCILPVSHA